MGRDSAAPKLNLLDSSAIEEKTRVIKAFKQTYSFLTDIMAGTNLNSLLDKFCVKNLLNENQVAHLRSMPAGRDQVCLLCLRWKIRQNCLCTVSWGFGH